MNIEQESVATSVSMSSALVLVGLMELKDKAGEGYGFSYAEELVAQVEELRLPIGVSYVVKS